MAVADVAPGLVPLPDQRFVTGFRKSLGGVRERGVPAPCVCSGQSHAALEQVHGCLVAHAAACVEIVRMAVAAPGPGIDDNDIQWLKRMVDSSELLFHFTRGHYVAIRQMSEVQ